MGCSRNRFVLDDECAEHFAIVLSLLEDELKPVTGIEQRSVETMALAQWRQLRLWSVEKVQIDREARKQHLERYGQEFNQDNEVDTRPVTFAALAFRAMSDESRALELVGRLDARYDRQYKSALSSFNAHRRARLKEARREAREARRALSRAARNTGGSASGAKAATRFAGVPQEKRAKKRSDLTWDNYGCRIRPGLVFEPRPG